MYTHTVTANSKSINVNSLTLHARLACMLNAQHGIDLADLDLFSLPSLIRVALRPICGERLCSKQTVRELLAV